MSSSSKSGFDRIIDTIEWMAALFVGIVAANIFLAVFLRKFFDTSIPDSFDFGRMLLGILIFWGIAATSYRGNHITVELLWTHANTRWKRYIDIFATLVLMLVVPVRIALGQDRGSPEAGQHERCGERAHGGPAVSVPTMGSPLGGESSGWATAGRAASPGA